jgi:hypothetical protein
MDKIILSDLKPGNDANSLEIADILTKRLGLMPRKEGSTEKMNLVLLELYERAKSASREKSPTKAVMTVEEMSAFAGITRQTMYDYLKRWLGLDLITKATYINSDEKVVIGYKLNGNTIEAAFDHAKAKIETNLEETRKIILELQKTVKNEKISQGMKDKDSE